MVGRKVIYYSMKICSKCRVEKPETAFNTRKDSRDGLRSTCKVCRNMQTNKWTRANPGKRAISCAKWKKANPGGNAASCTKWRKENPEKNAASIANWREANPEKAAATDAKWDKANPEKRAAHSAKRLAQKLQATPAWANQGYIEDVYRKAAIFTKRDGTPWHVDHIVPLKSPRVCGLHCEDNLQAISGADNMTKGNRSWPDMPGAL